jgi:hypothetical protein
MSESERPQSPFAGMADFSARTPLRVLSPDEIERMLAEHRLYMETEYHQGHRGNFSSADPLSAQASERRASSKRP